jgi:DNA-binding MarR family transcriptional regulator
MHDMLRDVTDYLGHAAGLAVEPRPWRGEDHLPRFLQDRYDFHEIQLLGTPCLLMLDRHDHDVPPATVRKHIDQVHRRWGGPVALVRRAVAAYNRKRLIEQGVPFIVPGNQMYLPPLGIDLREHYRKRQVERPQLRPSSQAVLIHMLLHDDEEFGLAGLASALGYSAMTVSRGLDELQTARLVDSYKHGRERRVHLADPKRELWQRAQPYLRDPVQRRHWALPSNRCGLPGPRAGLAALADYSDLADPHNPVVALSRDDWSANQQRDALREVEAPERDAMQVEVWTYQPRLFASDGLVDRLSLYLSLRETDDERIESALETMMQNARW